MTNILPVDTAKGLCLKWMEELDNSLLGNALRKKGCGRMLGILVCTDGTVYKAFSGDPFSLEIALDETLQETRSCNNTDIFQISVSQSVDLTKQDKVCLSTNSFKHDSLLAEFAPPVYDKEKMFHLLQKSNTAVKSSENSEIKAKISKQYNKEIRNLYYFHCFDGSIKSLYDMYLNDLQEKRYISSGISEKAIKAPLHTAVKDAFNKDVSSHTSGLESTGSLEPDFPISKGNCAEPPFPSDTGDCAEPPFPTGAGDYAEPPFPTGTGDCAEPPFPTGTGDCAEPPFPSGTGDCAEPPFPTGTGDCAEPRLLNECYKNRKMPLSMAVFYYGNGNKEHKKFYTPCDARCKPVLKHIIGLDIVYLDDDIVVVNKPSGLLSIEGKTKKDCIASRVRELFHTIPQPCVHRLDQATSGLLVLARTALAHRNLSMDFENRHVYKEYTALVRGLVTGESGTIDLPIRLDVNNRPYQIVDYEQGKNALTEWRRLSVIRKDAGVFTKLLLIPKTGRTHQLRVHCAYGLGAPILNDALYGETDEKDTRTRGYTTSETGLTVRTCTPAETVLTERTSTPAKTASNPPLALRATLLRFNHPVTGKELSFEVPFDFRSSHIVI